MKNRTSGGASSSISSFLGVQHGLPVALSLPAVSLAFTLESGVSGV